MFNLNTKGRTLESKKLQILITVYIVGLIGMSLPLSRPVFQYLIGVNILFSLGVLLFKSPELKLKNLLPFTLIFAIGYSIEAIGVNTGKIFGEYSYGNFLGPKIWETPLLIGVNWLMMILCCWGIAQLFKVHFLLKIVISAILMTAFDVVLEPMAIKLEMWTWTAPLPPFQNYLAWFIISLVFSTFLYLFKIRCESKTYLHLYLVQTGFFILLNLIWFLS